MKFPIPKQGDKFVYWLIAAMAGAIAGSFTYQLLVKHDPL